MSDSCPGRCSDVMLLSVKVGSLEDWAKRQNGTLQRLDERHERIEARNEQAHEAIRQRIEGIKLWLMGALLTACLTLAGVVFGIISLAFGK